MNMIKGLLHAKIMIPSGMVKEARMFYCDVLGLEDISRPISFNEGAGFWLRVGKDPIFVEECNNQLAGRGYFIFEIANIEELMARLRAYNIKLDLCERLGDYESFLCHDPFGNQLQFMMSIHNYQFVH